MNVNLEHADILEQLPLDVWEHGKPWEKAAYAAIQREHWHPIRGRKDRTLYLARFWLSTPEIRKSGMFESGNSILLHWIKRPDDDGALHDHPWDFTSHVLNGSYIEHTPDYGWESKDGFGPGSQTAQIHSGPYGLNPKQSTDLHRIAWVARDTWTLVTTGERKREWGFWPDDGVWQDWRTYLKIPHELEKTEDDY